MQKLNSYTLQLKLNRHKLNNEVSVPGDYMELGGSSTSTSEWILKIILPIAVAAFVLLFNLSGIAGYISGSFFIILVVGSYGIYNFIKVQQKNAGNRDIKVFENGKVRLYSEIDKTEKEFKTEEIKDFKIVVDDSQQDKVGFRGTIVMIDSAGGKNHLLEIWDDEKKELLIDLEYFKAYMEKIIGFEVSTENEPSAEAIAQK